MRIVWLLVCLSFMVVRSAAQRLNLDSLYQEGVCDINGYALTSIKGFPKPKGVEIYQERTPDFKISSLSLLSDSTYTEEIRRSRISTLKFRLPLVNREQIKVVVGLGYSQMEFAFEPSDKKRFSLHNSLNDKPIKSIGNTLYLIRPMKGAHFITSRASFRFNGDFAAGNLSDYLKLSVSALYGKRVHRRKLWGYGLSYSNTFGRSSIYPIVFYRNLITDKIAFDATLPVRAKLAYMPNERNTLVFNAKFEGDNYNLNFDNSLNQPTFLENTDFKLFVSFEKEIVDFLWFSVNAGYRNKVSFEITDSDRFFERNLPIGINDNLVVRNDISDSFFMRFGIFMVPPKTALKSK